MERQTIRDQIGALEEQLELLETVAFANGAYLASGQGSLDLREDTLVHEASAAVRRLQEIMQEQGNTKSIRAEDFLERIAGLLVKEARAYGFELAISTYGSGKVSIDLVEVSLGAILACLRASLKSFKGMGKALRVKNHLFGTFSFYLEILASPGELYFRLMDDGQGYTGSFRTEFETEQHFQKIRTHIARFGGWFKRSSLKGCGGTIEFKLPQALSRFECLRLKGRDSEVLLPSCCVSEGHSESAEADPRKTMMIDERNGLVPADSEAMKLPLVRVAVADFQFWIAGELGAVKVKTRKESAAGLVEPHSWIRNFGIFQENGISRALPLLEGEALMEIHMAHWGNGESI